MTALNELNDSLHSAVESVHPGVVRVEGRHRATSSGTVWSADGIIITAAHTLQREGAIGIGLSSGDKITADVVGEDPTTDIGVLRVKGAQLHAPTWADENALKIGQ